MTGLTGANVESLTEFINLIKELPCKVIINIDSTPSCAQASIQ